MSAAVLEARGVGLDYAGSRVVHALRGVDLALSRGEFVGVIGPSGSGKSSLLYVLAGLRRPTQGEVRFLGELWPQPLGRGADRRRRSLGFVFQEPFLVSHLTLGENIQVQCPGNPVAPIVELAEQLGIAHLLDEFPHRVSAGERQRASIARALVNRPVLVLADEPTASLDSENGFRVISLLTRAARDVALVVCSHDLRMLASAGRVYCLRDGALAAEARDGESGNALRQGVVAP